MLWMSISEDRVVFRHLVGDRNHNMGGSGAEEGKVLHVISIGGFAFVPCTRHRFLEQHTPAELRRSQPLSEAERSLPLCTHHPSCSNIPRTRRYPTSARNNKRFDRISRSSSHLLGLSEAPFGQASLAPNGSPKKYLLSFSLCCLLFKVGHVFARNSIREKTSCTKAQTAKE